MAVRINNMESNNRKVTQRLGNFNVIEYTKDLSVAPDNAVSEYFMAKMDVRRRQLAIALNGNDSATVQAGAMQWTTGSVAATTGVKGVGDLFGKMARSMVTKESAIKPEYVGAGMLVLEPTYKYIILQDVASWGPSGMAIEDGMFLACAGSVQHKAVARSSISSAVAGGEGLFNLCLSGQGIAALESNVPLDELIEVELDNDVLKIDGNMAVAWTAGLQFTVERSGKSLVGSAASGEGLVNVYRGTGKILMSPVAQSYSLGAATH
ncbi:MAG: AIM24 family protein [Clostridia bacterium]|nr:AIM24 family protein [Clostridia bacterium]NCC44552.1 AIM24 family protein [Clostridia bacterium]